MNSSPGGPVGGLELGLGLVGWLAGKRVALGTQVPTSVPTWQTGYFTTQAVQGINTALYRPLPAYILGWVMFYLRSIIIQIVNMIRLIAVFAVGLLACLPLADLLATCSAQVC